MGVEQEPEPASLELLWGTLAMVRGGWEAGWSPWRAHSLRLGVGLGTCEGPLKAKRWAGAWGPRSHSGRGPPRVPAWGTGELSQMWMVEQETQMSPDPVPITTAAVGKPPVLA